MQGTDLLPQSIMEQSAAEFSRHFGCMRVLLKCYQLLWTAAAIRDELE
jgi:hypothetical protein